MLLNMTINPLAMTFPLRGDLPSIEMSFRPCLSTAGETSAFVREILSGSTAGVVDVYPLNGTSRRGKFNAADYLRPKHRTEIQQQLECLGGFENYTRCMVIDFKDRQTVYVNGEEIQATEQAFVNFFRGPRPSSTTQMVIYDLIRNNRIDYFINEGSLKAHLIAQSTFNDMQAAFFQKTEEGGEMLCQVCEVIMNGFKQGYEVTVNGQMFRSEDYITSVSTWSDRGEMLGEMYGEVIPLHLATLYPSNYKETYGQASHYYQLISNVFNTNHREENGTTIITIE